MRFRFGNASRSGNRNRAAGGGCLILFGLVFGGMGLAFFVFLAKQALDEAATYQWTETPCTIRSFEIRDNVNEENPFSLEVQYAYEFGGQTYTSTRYALQDSRYEKYEKLALKRNRFLSDGAVCYVNPEDPSSAVLDRQGLQAGLFALFPLIFVTVGAGIIWAGIATLRKQKKAKTKGTVESISAGARSRVQGWKVGAAFGGIFFVVGAALLYPLGISPITKMIRSQDWIETPCQVLWSTVRRHESTDSDGHTSITYSVDIFYEYEFGGTTHRSNNYGFMGGSSSGRSGKQAVIKQYPKGSQQTCYVNPDLPEQAVLKPGLGLSALLALIPALFTLVGGLVLFGSLRSGAKKRRGSTEDHRGNDLRPSWDGGDGLSPFRNRETAAFDSSPRVLSPGGSRIVKLFVILGIALFWNGIVSVFVYQVVQGFRGGNPEWFLTIFMIPFVLVGLGLLFGLFYQLLALANPRPVITLRPGTIRLGEPFELRWEMRGSASRISSLKMSIRGVEAATYRRGTNTHTSHEVFYAHEFVTTSQLREMNSGAASLTLPRDLMYSFDAGNNEIKYELRIDGDIPFWPDIGDQYDLDVLPHASST